MFDPTQALAWAAAQAARRDGRRADGTRAPGTATNASGGAVANSLNPSRKGGGIEYGVVVDVVGGAHAYRVSCGDGSFVWCSCGGLPGFGTYGQRPLTGVTIAQRVGFVRYSETPYYGTILFAEAIPAYTREFHPADQLWPVFRSGHAGDQAHREPIESGRELAALAGIGGGGAVDIWDIGGGRPLDATAVGEWGTIAETGVGVYADPFHAALRADETTGIWAWYQDQTLRMAGVNVQKWSALSESEDWDDAGELGRIDREWTYRWEGQGLSWWNQVTGREDNGTGQGVTDWGTDLAQGGTGLSARDLTRTDVTPIARRYGFGGYLGQGRQEAVAAPLQFRITKPVAHEYRSKGAGYYTPVQAEQAEGTVLPDIHYYVESGGEPIADGEAQPDEDPEARVPAQSLRLPSGHQPGLMARHETQTGALHWAVTKRIVFTKRMSIPLARQRRRPEDPAGDAQGSAYAPGGLEPPPDFSGGADAWAKHKVRDQLEGMGEGRGAAAIADVLAYAFNWERLHAFAYHRRDWDVPDEGLAGTPIVNQSIPAFARLACAQHLADPPPVEIDIDHRYKAGHYYQTESVFAMLDDGSVYIHDGYANQLIMGPDGVKIYSASDILLASGRNIELRAGHDLLLRARDSIDGTATEHDIRFASARNYQVVAGTSGCGGVLLETQAICPSYAFEERFGEEVGSSGIVMIAPNSQVYALAKDIVLTSLAGRIISDAGPSGTIRTIGKFHHEVVYGTSAQFFVVSGVVGATNEFTAGSSLFTGSFSVRGTARATGGYSTAGGTLAAAIHSRSDYASDYGDGVLAAVSAPVEATLAEFSMRTDEQYLTLVEYTAWRPRWMTLAEESGQTLPRWFEYPITSSAQGFAQFPYPGSAWVDPAALKTSPPFLVDPDRGWVAASRYPNPGQGLSRWETPDVPDPDTQSFQAGWMVIMPPDGHGYCGSGMFPPATPGSFEATLAGGWGWPNEGKEGNLAELLEGGNWPPPPVQPPPPVSPLGGGWRTRPPEDALRPPPDSIT